MNSNEYPKAYPEQEWTSAQEDELQASIHRARELEEQIERNRFERKAFAALLTIIEQLKKYA